MAFITGLTGRNRGRTLHSLQSNLICPITFQLAATVHHKSLFSWPFNKLLLSTRTVCSPGPPYIWTKLFSQASGCRWRWDSTAEKVFSHPAMWQQSLWSKAVADLYKTGVGVCGRGWGHSVKVLGPLLLRFRNKQGGRRVGKGCLGTGERVVGWIFFSNFKH